MHAHNHIPVLRLPIEATPLPAGLTEAMVAAGVRAVGVALDDTHTTERDVIIAAWSAIQAAKVSE